MSRSPQSSNSSNDYMLAVQCRLYELVTSELLRALRTLK